MAIASSLIEQEKDRKSQMALDEVLGMARSNRFILVIHHIKSNWFSFRVFYLKWMVRIYTLIIGLRGGSEAK